MNKQTVYLAGKITGDPCYKAKFENAARNLTDAGFTVISPVMLPSEGFTYEAYMRMTSAMLDECEIVCFLHDWIDSRGAQFEYGRAVAQGKQVIHYWTWLDEQGAMMETMKSEEETTQWTPQPLERSSPGTPT